jgi:flagellar hook-associated protein 2
MSLSGINFSGLGSGIDTETIIKQLSQISQRPIQKMQLRQQQIEQQQTSIAQISGIIAGLQSAATALDGTTSFTGVKASSLDETIATVSAQSGAAAGSHTLQVTNLAQTQKLGSTPQTSQTAALGVSGQIVINGKAITVAATDTLQTIASTINGAQAGVSASIISTATDSYTLVLSSGKSGTANTISLSDTAGGTILRTTLGLIGAGTSLRHAVTNGAASDLFSDSSTSVGTLLGLTSPQSGTIQIDGTGVAIDFATDSLTAIASKINTAAITGVTASVVSTTDSSGASKQQLKIVGASTPTFTDANNILTNLGVLQNAAAEELVEAEDATFVLDGLNITRGSNSVTDVLSGVTINLLDDTDSPTTEINVTPDTGAIKENITTFVNQYNQLVRTVGNLASFDPQTLTGGPLFGDVTVQGVVDQITDILTGTVSGLTGTKTLLAQIGITLDKTGIFSINDSELDAALKDNLTDVAKIFRATGVASSTDLTFISATQKTKASSSTGYEVNVTQVATKATVTAGTTHSADDNPDSEVLTFTGGQFGTGGKSIILNPNSSLDGIVSQINADKTVGKFVSAANVGGKLALTSKLYGAANSFFVASSQSAAANNSGIGMDTLTATGVDVAGTINGETATGNGQFLTGNTGNANTEGLQVRVTASITGSLGYMVFTQGLAAQTKYFAKGASDAIDGTLTAYSNSLSEQVKDITSSITSLQERLKDEEVRLRTRFAAMENAVSKIKAAGNGLVGLSPVS